MTFTIAFEINPPGVFGLAETHTTVIPPASQSMPFGFVFDRKECRVIDRTRETSIYRADQEKIDIPLMLGNAACRVLDPVARKTESRTLTLKGFKSIRSLEDFPLRTLNILIGANGAGKSNFVNSFNESSEFRQTQRGTGAALAALGI